MSSRPIHAFANTRICLKAENILFSVSLHFLYPFFCWLLFKLLSYIRYCKWCCNECGCADIFSRSWFHFLWIHPPKVGLLDHMAVVLPCPAQRVRKTCNGGESIMQRQTHTIWQAGSQGTLLHSWQECKMAPFSPCFYW